MDDLLFLSFTQYSLGHCFLMLCDRLCRRVRHQRTPDVHAHLGDQGTDADYPILLQLGFVAQSKLAVLVGLEDD